MVPLLEQLVTRKGVCQGRENGQLSVSISSTHARRGLSWGEGRPPLSRVLDKPTLDEIENNIFGATERYLAAAKTNKNLSENQSQSTFDATHATAALVKNASSGRVSLQPVFYPG